MLTAASGGWRVRAGRRDAPPAAQIASRGGGAQVVGDRVRRLAPLVDNRRGVLEFSA
jgi:hypothetical protein